MDTKNEIDNRNKQLWTVSAPNKYHDFVILNICLFSSYHWGFYTYHDSSPHTIYQRVEQSIQKTRQQRDAALKLQQEARDRARKQQEEQERIEREQKEAAERKLKEERDRNEKEKREKMERDMKAAAAKQKAQEVATVCISYLVDD